VGAQVTLVITVALLKGGASKTTSAVALAEAAALSVPTVLIDTDPMGSAIRWAELADQSGHPLRAEVVRQQSTDLVAVRTADHVVMPVPPKAADLDRVAATAQIAASLGKPAAAVLTQVRGGIEDAVAARSVLRSWGVRVYGAYLPLTVQVQRCYGQPVTGPLLAFGISLLTEITKET
jgi:chromosome partitioning protein